MKRFLTGARIVTGGKIIDGMDIEVENGTVLGIVPHVPFRADALDLCGMYIAPGFIDMHVHGGDGFEFIDGTEEAFRRACALHAGKGTRVLFPTISAAPAEVMYRALETAERVMKDLPAEIPGIHLEGPYLSADMCGAQDTSVIRRPDPKEYLPLLERFAPIISRWSYAPEKDEDGAFLKALNRYGVVPAIANSAAEYAQILPAYENGLRLVTHLYSATSTVTRHGGFRHLGVIESAFLLDEMDVEAIADGCHLPAELMRMIVKIKGADHVALITDAIRHAGMTNIDHVSGGTERIPYIIEDGVAKLADRSAFAGSIATTEQLLKRTAAAGIPLTDTVRMMTETPARIMKLPRKGRIAPGCDASFTVFDENLNVQPL